MHNHYRNNPEKLSTWREYIGWDPINDEYSEIEIDIWPRRLSLVARIEGGQKKMDAMTWGVPCQMPGKRPGTKITKHVTNVRNGWKAVGEQSAARWVINGKASERSSFCERPRER